MKVIPCPVAATVEATTTPMLGSTLGVVVADASAAAKRLVFST